jgi:predicted unusual protein kinase regulating ubiquinone biosynthesis (AarF/ABC1/UbiB family)
MTPVPADDAVRRLDALLVVALRLVRSAPSGRTALAQLAAVIEPAWLPQPWGRDLTAELAAASAEATEPIPFARVQRVLRDAWGEPPEHELDELDPEPVLTTPVAQVHRGVLDGAPVALKALRPGLAGLVRQDLALLETLAAPIAAAFPAVDVAGLLREVRERVLDDLDFESQGQAQRRFHRALRQHPLFHIPAPITRLTHDSVLVSEWVDGTPLADAPPKQRDRAAGLLVLFALGAARWGTAHADLQLREVLVLDDGRIAIVDFGATARASAERVGLGAQLLEAFVAEDADGAAAALSSLGVLPRELAGTATGLARHALGPFAGAGPVRLDNAAVEAVRDRVLERPEAMLSLVAEGRLEPEDLWPMRGLGQLFALIARAGATAPWRELARLGLREGWDARPER